MRLHGFVRAYWPRRGYGFGMNDNGDEFWFHITSADVRELQTGDEIEYTRVMLPKGAAAVKIKLLKRADDGEDNLTEERTDDVRFSPT